MRYYVSSSYSSRGCCVPRFMAPVSAALAVIYTVDLLLSLYSGVPLWLAVLLTPFILMLFPITMAMAALPLIPIFGTLGAFSKAFSPEAPPCGRIIRIAALPIGIAVAFIIWRTMAWFFHHVLAIEPQLYDAVFGWLG